MQTTLTRAPQTADDVIALAKVLGKAKSSPLPAIHALVATGNSIRRSSAIVAELGAQVPEVDETSPVHFYTADAKYLARCGAGWPQRVTRHGSQVTCDDCKALYRAEAEARVAAAEAALASDYDADGALV